MSTGRDPSVPKEVEKANSGAFGEGGVIAEWDGRSGACLDLEYVTIRQTSAAPILFGRPQPPGRDMHRECVESTDPVREAICR